MAVKVESVKLNPLVQPIIPDEELEEEELDDELDDELELEEDDELEEEEEELDEEVVGEIQCTLFDSVGATGSFAHTGKSVPTKQNRKVVSA